MIGKRRYGRPGTSDVIKMIVVNLIIASVTLLVVFKIFGMGIAIGQLPIGEDKNAREIMWTLYSFILPGAGIGFALLWFWLILTGRTVKGLNWGAAYVYGGAGAPPRRSIYSGASSTVEPNYGAFDCALHGDFRAYHGRNQRKDGA
ncbi:MAG: hypothetical protein NT023_00600 [Armatimonadetes bacterium]|nr:hypothetical protein [Armatimonadota bacterium]